MNSQNDERHLADRMFVAHSLLSLKNSSDQSSSNTCSRIGALSCGITSSTTPTITSTVLRNIDDHSVGLSSIEPPLEHEHQARFRPPAVPYSYFSKQGNGRVDDRKYSSDQALNSYQSPESLATSRSFKTGQSGDKRTDKYSSTADISGVSSAATSIVKIIETSCSELRLLLLDNQHKESFDSSTVYHPFPKQRSTDLDADYSSPNQLLDSLTLSSKSTGNSETEEEARGNDCNGSAKGKCSSADGLVSGVNLDAVSTILKNIETSCSELKCLLLGNQRKESLETPVMPVYSFPEQRDTRLVDGHFSSSGRFPLSSKLINNPESSKTHDYDSTMSVKNNECSSADGLISGIKLDVVSTILKNIEASCSGLRCLLLGNQRKESLETPVMPVSSFPEQRDTRLVDGNFSSSGRLDDNFPLSSELTDNSESSKAKDDLEFAGRMCSPNEIFNSTQQSSISKDNSKPVETCYPGLLEYLLRNKKSSRTDSIRKVKSTSSITTKTAPTTTCMSMKNLYDSNIKLSHTEPPAGYQNQSRSVSHLASFSILSKQSCKNIGDCSDSSENILDSLQGSSVSSSTSRSFQTNETGGKNILGNGKNSNVAYMTRGNASLTTCTLTSTTLRSVEDPFLNPNTIEPSLEYEHQARFAPPVAPFSYLPKENSRTEDHMHQSDASLDLSLSSVKLTTTSETSKMDKSRTKLSSKDDKIRRA